MNRLNRIIETVSSVKSSWDSIWLKSLESKYLQDDVTTAPYSKSELCYVCISTTMRAIAQVPLKVYVPSETIMGRFFNRQKHLLKWKSGVLQDKDLMDTMVKRAELEPVPEDNPYQVLLDQPNVFTGSQLFKEAAIGHLLLEGNLWLVGMPLVDLANPTIIPDSLWIIKRKQIEPIRDGNGSLLAWKFVGGTNEITLSVEEVIHTKLWNPYDNVLGLAPTEAGGNSIRSSFKASKYNEEFFDSGAVPRGVLTTEGKLTTTQISSLREMFEERHKGYKKANRLAVLQKGLKYESTSLTQKDMEFLEGMKFSRETILQIYGMKKSIVSVTDDVNMATSQMERKCWWNDTNLPLMRLVASAINFGLLRNTPFIARFDTSGIEALQPEYANKVDMSMKLWQMGFTANEINEKLELGFDPKPWRDYAWAPVNLVQIEPSGEQNEDEEDNDPNDNDDNSDNDDNDSGDSNEDDEKVFPGNNQIEFHGIDRKEERLSKWKENCWKASMSRIEPLEKPFESKIKRVMFEMRKRTLDLLNKNTARGIKTLDEVINDLNFEAEKSLLQKMGRSFYEEALKQGASSVVAEVGLGQSFELTDPIAQSFLDEKLFKIRGIADTIHEQLNTQFSEAMKLGEDIPAVANRVRSVFNTSSSRATTIARTEMVGASNFGRNVQINVSQFAQKEWFTALDERVRADLRADHRIMHGQVIYKNDLWIMKDGSALRFPGDYAGSPANVINCRCIEVVVPESFKEPEIPYEDLDRIKSSNRLQAVSNSRLRGMLQKCYS